jgi:biotin carboxyl carrier protein
MQVVAVIEAMKMMNEIQAHRSGTVEAVLAAVGATVEPQTPLLRLSDSNVSAGQEHAD